MSVNIFNALKLLNPNDRVPKDVKKARVATCLACDKIELGICTECYCIVPGKTSIASEACPLGKWDVWHPEHSDDKSDQ